MPHKIKAYRNSVPHTKLKRTMKAFVKITATVFICIAALVPAVICARPAGLVPDNTHEIIKDPAFRNGFTLLSPNFSSSGGRIIVDTLVFTPKSAAPAWRIAQWHSRYDLADGKDRHGNMRRKGKNTYNGEYSNKSKCVRRSKGGTLFLGIDTKPEYNHPRRADEQWPHLLIEQDFDNRPNAGKSSCIVFSMAYRLEYCEKLMTDSEYNEALHTAQSPLYFILRNTNPQSADCNKFIWLGIQTFDYRYRQTTEHETISWDAGTNTYIYNIPQRPLWGDIDFHDGKWHRLQADLLPHIRMCLDKMKEKGFFKDTNLSDLEISGMNFGWEVPGTFRAAASIKDLSLRTTAR